MKFPLRFLCHVLVLILASCSRTNAPSAARPEKLEACALLTAEEVAATQGAPVQTTQSNDRSTDTVTLAQCAFTLPNASDSVILILKQRLDPAAPGDPVRLWEKTFKNREIDPEGEEEREGKETQKPVHLTDLGDEAYWVGGQFGGTLHVLKGTNWIQLSVGGPGDQNAKIEQMKTLAGKVLGRL